MLKNNDLAIAENLLKEKSYACVVVRDGDVVFSSEKRGIAPLVEFNEFSDSRGGFSLADKVIGKAAALLCIYSGVGHVYANVISTPAVNALVKNNIDVSYDSEVPSIKNRAGDGLCPMEKLSEGVGEPAVMFDKVVRWLESIKLSGGESMNSGD